MKRILFFHCAIFCFAVSATAQEPAQVPAVNSGMDVERAIADAGNNPQGHSPLVSVEQTVRGLLDVNSALTREYHELNEQILGLQADIEAQKQKNQEQIAAIPEQRAKAVNPESLEQLRVKVSQAEKDIADERDRIEDLKGQLRGADAALSLWRLKLKEGGIQKETLMVDHKAYEQNVIGELRYAIQDLQAKADAVNGQDQYFQEKLNKLKQVGSPYIKKAKDLSDEIAALQKALAQRSQKAAEAAETMNSLAHRKTALENDRKTRRYFHLSKVSDDLVARIAEINVRKEDLSRALEAVNSEKIEEAEEKETTELILQNEKLQEEADHLRENIALLEYGVNAIQRYKGRNRKEGR